MAAQARFRVVGIRRNGTRDVRSTNLTWPTAEVVQIALREIGYYRRVVIEPQPKQDGRLGDVMSGWQGTLAALVRFGKDLPEPMQTFRALPPAGRRWPKGLPSCPPLVDFYELCDGGFFYCWRFLPLREVKRQTAALQSRAQVLLGYGSDPFALIWDSGQDEVIAGSPHPDESYRLASSFAEFIDELFTPRPASDELAELWGATLRHLDSLVE